MPRRPGAKDAVLPFDAASMTGECGRAGHRPTHLPHRDISHVTGDIERFQGAGIHGIRYSDMRIEPLCLGHDLGEHVLV